MASKRPAADNKSKEARARDDYHNFVQASLEATCIDWDEDDNTPPCCSNEKDSTKECKQRKLAKKVTFSS